jgi:hypothetical protein
VQALPSLHVVPSVLLGFEQVPSAWLHVPATWHWSSAVQVTGLPPVQAPDWQLSVWVQALPSLQVVPFAAFGFEQVPFDGLQVPATWHWSCAAQVTAVPVQVPLWQASAVVQAFPSLQVVPLVLFGFEQTPFDGLQVPATWHWSSAVQVTGIPVQAPPWQASAVVQALPSLQVVPFAAFGFVQTPVDGLQVPATWH